MPEPKEVLEQMLKQVAAKMAELKHEYEEAEKEGEEEEKHIKDVGQELDEIESED